jgi:threonylcarbamoyladenosine tRNA methylthiotransferase MtaB
MASFFIENFGCRAARADGEAVGAHLRATGLDEQSVREAALVIVNTCSVTGEADRAARAFIRRAHRQNPEAKIVVTGCYAQRAPEELAAIPGVSAVIGNSHKALAPEIALGLLQSSKHRLSGAYAQAESLVQIGPAQRSQLDLPESQSMLAAQAASATPQVVWADDQFAHSFIEEAPLSSSSQTRPNLKIQEGCSNRCTFCVIPLTRGPSKSLPHAVVLQKVREFVTAGGNELVLSGINLGRWGRDHSTAQPNTLANLVRSILDLTALPRLRLSSIEPMDWNDELIDLMRQFGGTRLARLAHLPLQSGSDSVLRRMHRRYRPWHYADKVAALLRAAGPDLTFGADVMVGFPGESDREFEESLSFIRSLPFGYLHLFPFSPRPGTLGWAAHAASSVPAPIVGERMAALRDLAAEKSFDHRSRFIGCSLPAITLQTPAHLVSSGRTSAITDNFLPTEIDGIYPANHLVQANITGLSPEGSLLASSLQ